MASDSDQWFEDYADDIDETQIGEYDITSSPNDFNVITLHNFVESGAVLIPGFQRNFVWDKLRASKLIESLVLGIPVPQIFLYEQSRNKFYVIDGQQRLMSIFYFLKKRFPRRDKRVELRSIFDKEGYIPERILHSSEFFEDFKLKLPERLPNRRNLFTGLNYSTLGDYKTQLDLRPIRAIVVKQNSPSGDDSAIYEVFNRLNTGGVNLRPQEIRMSMYHSGFYDLLRVLNLDIRWRRLLQSDAPDLHMKDVEIMLRGFAMLMRNNVYAPSMVRFLNQFSRQAEQFNDADLRFLKDLFESFLDSCDQLTEDAFINRKNNRFNIALFEAVFTACCEDALEHKDMLDYYLDQDSVTSLERDDEFSIASIEGTTSRANVETRLGRARELVGSLRG